MADQEAKIDLGIDGLGPAEHIGRGGFADVYRAEQLSLRRTVAVKVLRAQASDTEAEAKFERECHAIGAVSDHPHIVGVHEGGFTRNGRAYLVMEYLPGGSLLDRLNEYGPMPVADIVDTTAKIAKALAVAHLAGVLHRDVKPANIMISAYGEPALGDFGIARIEGGHQTATGLVTASFAHAAPEVLEGLPADASADIYSLGSTMYELMTGQAPYFSATDETIWPLMKRILSEPMRSPESAGMSPKLGEIFAKATSRDPAGRYDDAEHMAEDLTALVSDPLALTRYPTIDPVTGVPSIETIDGGDETRTLADVGPMEDPPSAAVSGSRIGAGLPVGPPPATKPDLMSLRRADTDVLSQAGADSGTGRFSDRFGADRFRAPQPAKPQAKSRLGTIVGIVSVAVILGAAVGGAFLWMNNRDDMPAAGSSSVVAELAAAQLGPLQAGESYDVQLGSTPNGAELRLVIDGEPTGAPAVELPPFTPSVGRHALAVEISTAAGTELTNSIEFYAQGGGPTAGYTASLGRVAVGGDGWLNALAVFDKLTDDGHEILELVATDELANLTPGHWSVYVPGFEEDGDAAEAYCDDFGLQVPDFCNASYFRPIE